MNVSSMNVSPMNVTPLHAYSISARPVMFFARARCLLVCALLPLAGCGFASSRQDALYVVQADLAAPPECALPLPLAIDLVETEAAPGLESSRIAIRSGARLQYYSGARWAAATPRLWDAALTEALEHSGCFRDVALESEGVHAPLTLAVSLRAFEVEEDAAQPPAPEDASAQRPSVPPPRAPFGHGATRVHVRLVGHISGEAQQRLSSVTAEETALAHGARMEDIVRAFQAASRAAMRTLIVQAHQATSFGQKAACARSRSARR